jgi:hypothetical protein
VICHAKAGVPAVHCSVRAGSDSPRLRHHTRGSNAVTLSYSWNGGSLLFGPTLPIEDGKRRFQLQILSFYHA